MALAQLAPLLAPETPTPPASSTVSYLDAVRECAHAAGIGYRVDNAIAGLAQQFDMDASSVRAAVGKLLADKIREARMKSSPGVRS